MKVKKKWIVIAVIVLLALFGAIGGKGSDKVPEDSGEASVTEASGAEDQAQDPEEASEQEAGGEETAGAETDEAESESAASDGISPELKEFLDSYEAFMDEYCEFMLGYNESDTAQLLKYAALMEKYYEFSEKAEASMGMRRAITTPVMVAWMPL